MPATQKNRLLAIGTVLGDDQLLIKSFSLSEQLGRMFQAEAELASEDPAIDFDKVVGSNATVRLELQNGKTRYFNGYISRFVQTGQSGDYARYRATLVPWLWFLTRTADCRIFQKKTVPDIIEEVFKGHGFKDYKLKLTGSHPEWEYCVQYRETDLNFVSRLMEQEGIYYFFEHEDGVHTVILADAASAHEPFEGYEEFIYRTRTHQGKEAEESVTDWVIEKEVQPGVYALADFNFKNPGAPVVVNANKARKHEAAGFEIFDHPGEYDERGEGEACAKIRIEELQAQHEILRAQATIRAVSAGCKFTLKQHPRDDQNRECLITGMSLQVRVGEFKTAGAGGEKDSLTCRFTAMPADEQFRSARITPKPVIQGPQTAIVVGKAGEEIDTDEFGRVKVQFHWDRYGKVDENSSCWVRVSQSVAGKGWGAITIPRIGQEVIVEFLEGDPDLPIITGRVYNATNKVPYPLPDNKTRSTLKTDSSKGGQGFNEIRFEDKKGEEEFFIHAEKDQQIRVKNDCIETIMHDRHLIVENDQFEHVKNERSEKVDRSHFEEIGQDRNLTVKGKEAKEVKQNLSLTVQGKVEEDFKQDHSETVSSNYKLEATQVTIEAKSKIELKVGGSSITMEAAKIELKAPQVAVSGDAKVDIQGGAAVKIQGGMVQIN
jgi:type VI secretion system secreted protein VgrG